MSFVDVGFLFFLPVVWLVHWALPRRSALQNGWLLGASYVFCASWDPRMLGVLVASTLVDYAIGRGLARGRHRLALLWCSVAFNLAVLAFCKYAGFFADEMHAVLLRLGLDLAPDLLRFALPVGLSFYTLQKLSYIFDVYDGRQPPERSLLRFALFSSFFGQLIAGPISRAGQLLPQLLVGRRLLAVDVADGARLFLHGYVLKALVADRFGMMVRAGDGSWEGAVGPVFALGDDYSTAAHWCALLGYWVQIYADFAGYSLMAMGVARLFGLRLPVNFNLPYLATSLPEFWRRWHITLNTWLYDYIFTPLATGRTVLRGQVAVCLMVVFVASGLWHGSSLPFLLWGALHGLGMVAHHLFDKGYKVLCRRDRMWVARRRSGVWVGLSWVMTQGFFLLTLVPFKLGTVAPAVGTVEGTSDLERTVDFFAALWSGQHGAGVDVGSVTNLAILVLCVAVLVWLHVVRFGIFRRLGSGFFALPAPMRGIAYGVLVAALVLLVPVGEGTFIYRNF